MPNENPPQPPPPQPPPQNGYYPTYQTQYQPPPGGGPDAELARLRAENASLNEELKDIRHEARDRRHELRTAQQQLTDLATERDRLQAIASVDPEGLRKRVGELQGEIRTTKHRQAFDKLARAQNVTDEARIDDLWSLSGYKPEADDPDPAKLGEVIATGLKSRPYLMDAATNGAGAPQPGPGGPPTGAGAPTNVSPFRPIPPPVFTPGPGGDRGQTVPPPPPGPPPSTRPPGRF